MITIDLSKLLEAEEKPMEGRLSSAKQNKAKQILAK